LRTRAAIEHDMPAHERGQMLKLATHLESLAKAESGRSPLARAS
jgi:hypothetical protein